MDPLLAIARARSLVVVEDAAQAIGARDRAGFAGAMGDAAAFSFFPAKTLGAWGDGGAVTARDPKVAARVKSLRQHGLVGPDEFAERGTNSRLDALHAAVLDVKARHLEAWTRGRRVAADRYRALLGDVDGIALPHERAGALHVYGVYAVRTARRDALAAHLASRGVASRAYYARPIHRQPAYARYHDPATPLPNADAASREILALPMFAEISEEAQAYVADAVRAFFHR
jgi:dTDP-4-amino-4,6-dideoxygalactose transaminase